MYKNIIKNPNEKKNILRSLNGSGVGRKELEYGLNSKD